MSSAKKKFDILKIVKDIESKYSDVKDYNMREVLADTFKKDMELDYPVQGHFRDGKPVKRHTRGEVIHIPFPKEYILQKVKIIKIEKEVKELKEKLFPSKKEYIESPLEYHDSGRVKKYHTINGEKWRYSIRGRSLGEAKILQKQLLEYSGKKKEKVYHHAVYGWSVKNSIIVKETGGKGGFVVLFQIGEYQDDFVEDFEQGNIALDLGEVLEIYAKRHDFLTMDASRSVGRPRKRGLKAGTSGAKISGAKRTKVGQSLLETLGQEAFQINLPDKITVPFSIMNTETGKSVQGEVVESINKNIIELTPVSSSNVKAAGQFKNELLVQFYPSGLDPQRTYRYAFEQSEQAREAYKSIVSSGSPGRWVWENLRGHIAGEPVSASKLAPSLSPPGQGLPTIGGTSASLVEYKISNRVPIKRIEGFEKMSNLLKRETSNPVSNPNTGSRIESLLGSRKELREVGMNPIKTAKSLGQLPKI